MLKKLKISYILGFLLIVVFAVLGTNDMLGLKAKLMEGYDNRNIYYVKKNDNGNVVYGSVGNNKKRGNLNLLKIVLWNPVMRANQSDQTELTLNQ